jgi:hypothetical protein
MATRAEQFRALAERSGPKRPPQVIKPKPNKPHNLSTRAERKATYEYEEQPVGQRPPRKSTRKSKNRQKHAKVKDRRPAHG